MPQRSTGTRASAISGRRDFKAPWLYPEWDGEKHSYIKDRCALSELSIPGGQDLQLPDLRKINPGYREAVRRAFTMLRPQAFSESRGLEDGHDIDHDRYVDSLMDLLSGRQMESNYYVFREKKERSVVAALLLDMSPSTRHFIDGRTIFEHEKYAAYLLAEAMESIGDRFGIFSYYDFGPSLTLFFPLKAFADRYAARHVELLQKAMPPEWGWSRLAVGLRHILQYLEGAEEKTRIIFFITDGRPVYYEDYVDEGKKSSTYQVDGREVEVSKKVRVCKMVSQSSAYVRADLQKVKEEATLAGVHLFCITLEEAAVEFMTEVFGSSVVYLPSPGQLPRRLLEIFRKVTT